MTLTVNSGATNVTGTNNFTGATTVNGGLLSVNGTSMGSVVTVNAGGTLGGNGTVGNTTIKPAARWRPAIRSVTLTVVGNLALTAASSYMVEVSPAGADRTNVTGTATLGGATVKRLSRPAPMSRSNTPSLTRPAVSAQHVRLGRQHQLAGRTSRRA